MLVKTSVPDYMMIGVVVEDKFISSGVVSVKWLVQNNVPIVSYCTNIAVQYLKPLSEDEEALTALAIMGEVNGI